MFKDGTLYYIETDHLGTPRQVVKAATNAVVWKWDFLQNTFGNSAPDEDADGNSVPFVLGMRFPGQYFDPETGLHFNNARYYDKDAGRYAQSDSIGLNGGINTYLYALSRPLTDVDPEGLAIWICGRAAFGGALGNHAYLWDDKKKRCCGMNHGHDPLASCKEKGPSSDSCILIGNSDGKEDEVMSCCQGTANKGVWPIRDCHDAANDCITKAGLDNPGAPGGRLGGCSSCWLPPPPIIAPMPPGNPYVLQ